MKKTTTYLLAAAVSALAFPATVSAQSTDIGSIYKQCGLGGAIFPDATDPIGPVLVNILVSSPLVLTQGLLLPDSCSGSAGLSARMMNAAYPQFEMEMAIGEGDYLNTLMDVMECDQSVRASLIEDMRENLSAKITSVAYAEMTQDEKARDMYIDMYSAVSANYAVQCAAIE